MEEFIALLTIREKTEKTYSNQLLKIANSAYELITDGYFIYIYIYRTLGRGFQAFRIDCLNRGEQASTLAKGIEEEIIPSLKIYNNNSEPIITSAQVEVKKWEKEIMKLHDYLQKNKFAYDRKCEEAEDTLYNCDDKKEYLSRGSEIGFKLNQRMNESLKEFKYLEKQYKDYILYSNQYLKQYNNAIVSLYVYKYL